MRNDIFLSSVSFLKRDNDQGNFLRNTSGKKSDLFCVEYEVSISIYYLFWKWIIIAILFWYLTTKRATLLHYCYEIQLQFNITIPISACTSASRPDRSTCFISRCKAQVKGNIFSSQTFRDDNMSGADNVSVLLEFQMVQIKHFSLYLDDALSVSWNCVKKFPSQEALNDAEWWSR